MARPVGGQFLSTTRGRVLSLLRGSPRTVRGLATALGLSPNAVRSQLTALQRDGLVRRAGQIPSGRRPSDLYDATAAAEALFTRAYVPLTSSLLSAAENELAPAGCDALLRRAGQRLAGDLPAALNGAEPAQRLHGAVQWLQDLGSTVEIEHGSGACTLRAAGCPIAEVAQHHPQACRVVQFALEAISGAPVVERCRHDGRPHCGFEIRFPAAGGQDAR